MSPDWLGAARRAAAALRTILAERPTTEQRVVETGTRGEGGDRTPEIDALAEEAVFTELAGAQAGGARFTVISEERGTVDFGGDGVLVVVDPIDGSMNAKRGLPHHCVSIAVADGPSMADVVFGFVQDFGPEEEWVAVSGAGATASSSWLASSRPTRAGCSSRPSGSWSSRTGCARSARSRPRCARSPPRASTGCCRPRARARSTPRQRS